MICCWPTLVWLSISQLRFGRSNCIANAFRPLLPIISIFVLHFRRCGLDFLISFSRNRLKICPGRRDDCRFHTILKAYPTCQPPPRILPPHGSCVCVCVSQMATCACSLTELSLRNTHVLCTDLVSGNYVFLFVFFSTLCYQPVRLTHWAAKLGG